MAGDDAGENEPADDAVRAELAQTIRGIFSRHSCSLPDQLCRRGGQSEPEQRAEPGRKTRCCPSNQRDAVEDEEPAASALAEGDRRGLHADTDVVLFVLMCVDRIVADCPEHAAEIEQQRRRSERAGDSGPSDQRTPTKVEAEEYLRPISD